MKTTILLIGVLVASIIILQSCGTEQKPDVCHELRVQYITGEWKVKTVEAPLDSRFYIDTYDGREWLASEKAHRSLWFPHVIDFEYIGLCK